MLAIRHQLISRISRVIWPHGQLVLLQLLAYGTLLWGFSAHSALLSTLFLLIQWWLGAEIAGLVLRRSITLTELLAFGGALSLLLVVIFNQSLIQIGISGRYTTICVGATALALSRFRRRCQRLALLNNEGWHLNTPLVSSAMICVTPGLSWTTLFGLGSLIMYLASRTDGSQLRKSLISRSGYAVATALTVGALGFVFFDRTFGAARNQDTQYFESMGILIARFGAKSGDPSMVDASIDNYHWLAYGWIGIINDFSSAPPFLIQDRLATFVWSLALAGALLIIATRVGASRIVSIMTAVFAIGLGVDILYYSWTLSASLCAVFLALAITALQRESLANSHIYVILGLFVIGASAILAKAHSLPIIIATSLALGLTDFVRRRRRTLLTYQALLCTSLIGVFALKYLPSPYDDNNDKAFDFSTIWRSGPLQAFWDMRGVIGPLLTIAACNIFLVCALVGVTKSFNRHKIDLRCTFAVVWSASLSTLFSVLILTVSGTTASTFASVVDFVQFWNALAAAILCILLWSVWFADGFDRLSRRALPTLTILALFSAIISFVLRTDIWRESVTITLWESTIGGSRLGRWIVYLIVNQASFSVAALIALVSLIGSQRGIFKLHIFAVTFLTVFVCSSGFTTYIRTAELLVIPESREQRLDINYPANRSNELIELGRLVRTSTPPDAIFASNNFCCKGEEWLDGNYRSRSASGYGGANFQLGAETQRRFLIQGPLFSGIAYQNRDFNAEERKRLQVSLSFANSPSFDDLLKLKGYGVDYFIVNLQLTKHSDWNALGDTLFRGTEFLLLRLG